MEFKNCIFVEVRQTFGLTQNKNKGKPKIWLSGVIYSSSILKPVLTLAKRCGAL